MKRTDYCGQVDRRHLGQTVTLMGWVHRRRDHGGVIFVDLRDREGLCQVVFDPDRAEIFAMAETLRNEFVVAVTGLVRPRPGGTTNPNLASGEIEVLAQSAEILNPSVTPPFQLDDENLSETVRLEHRVLDLRRLPMQRNLRLRHRAAMSARRYLDANGFIDIETPALYKSTPEGAREFLVPSRDPSRPVLCAAAIAAAVQADADDGGLRPLLPDRQVLPRRGPARRPPARVHADRRRDVVPVRARDPRGDGRPRPHDVQGRARRRAAQAVSDHDLRRRDARLRLRQARPSRAAQADRAHRPHEAGRLQAVPLGRRPSRTAASRRSTCRAEPR